MSSKYIIEIPALNKVVTATTSAATVKDLYRKFVKHNKLTEAAQFLGLTYIDQCGRCVWASKRTCMNDVDYSSLPPRFTLSVRKFPEDYENLSSSTIRMLYHYISSMVSMHPLPFEYHDDFNCWLAAYKARAENVDTSTPGFSVKAALMLPATNKEKVKQTEATIKKYLIDLNEFTEQQSMVKYLKGAYGNGCYYQTIFTVKSFNKTSVIMLGIGPTGIIEYVKSSGTFKLNEVIHWGQLCINNPLSLTCASLEVNYINGDEKGSKKYLCYRKDGEALLELAKDYVPELRIVVHDGRPNVTDVFVWPFWEFHGKQHAPDCNCYLIDEEIFWRETSYRPVGVVDVEVLSGAYSLSSIERHRQQLDTVYRRLFVLQQLETEATVEEPPVDDLLEEMSVVEVFQVKNAVTEKAVVERIAPVLPPSGEVVESSIQELFVPKNESPRKVLKSPKNKVSPPKDLEKKELKIDIIREDEMGKIELMPEKKELQPKTVLISEDEMKNKEEPEKKEFEPKNVTRREVMRRNEEAVRPDFGPPPEKRGKSKHSSKINWRNKNKNRCNVNETEIKPLPEKRPNKVWQGVKKTFSEIKVICPHRRKKSTKKSKRKTSVESLPDRHIITY